MAAGIVGFLVVTASLLLAFVPGDDVENPLTFFFDSSDIPFFQFDCWNRHLPVCKEEAFINQPFVN
jgi:hypothetical protein